MRAVDGQPYRADCFRDHHDADVIFTSRAILLGHDRGQKTKLGKSFEIGARICVRLIALDGIRAQNVVADLDQFTTKVLLLVRQKPIRIEFRVQP